MSDPRKGARIRATAATIVDAVVTAGRSLDVALAEHEPQLAPDDRALLRMLCYGAQRRHWRLQSCRRPSRPLGCYVGPSSRGS